MDSQLQAIVGKFQKLQRVARRRENTQFGLALVSLVAAVVVTAQFGLKLHHGPDDGSYTNTVIFAGLATCLFLGFLLAASRLMRWSNYEAGLRRQLTAIGLEIGAFTGRPDFEVVVTPRGASLQILLGEATLLELAPLGRYGRVVYESRGHVLNFESWDGLADWLCSVRDRAVS